MNLHPPVDVEIRHFHLFCGLGGGAKGFNRGRAELGNMRAKFRCIGGVDRDPAAIRDFGKLAGVPGTCLDLFDREQYIAFNGHQPPADWREAGPDEIRSAAGGEFPDIVFLSAPCKGFSGLLSETKSKTDKYQALNRLTLRGVWLMLEAFKDNLPSLILFENVPRIATRGRSLLDRITALLRHYGYAVAETTHDCGEIGGLAQSRKRFLMVGRNVAKVPAFLYEPEKRPLRAVGDVLGRMPLPGDPRGGAMHLMPRLHWKTWVRLAFVEAGADWRSLNKLNVTDGKLADYLIIPDTRWEGGGRFGVTSWEDHAGTVAGASRPENGPFSVADPRQEAFDRGYGVCDWNNPAHAVQGQSAPSNGEFAVADPRLEGSTYPAYGVRKWDDPSSTITGQSAPGGGVFAIADPRTGHEHHQNVYRVTPWAERAHTVTGASHAAGGAPTVADPRLSYGGGDSFKNVYRIIKWSEPSQTIGSGHGPSSGGMCIADPRPPVGPLFGKYMVTNWDENAGTVIGGDDAGAYAVADPRAPGEFAGKGKYKVTPFDQPAGTVIAESGTGNGGFAVADPRILHRGKGDDYLTGGHYGVVPWEGQSYSVSGAACHDNGPWSVADPRMPEQTEKLVAIIRSLDGTWHRPFTTLELAALQSLVDPDNLFDLDGDSDSAKRERIGNAVPPHAAQAIADLMGETILLSIAGESFQLSAANIWVRPVAVALSVSLPMIGGEA